MGSLDECPLGALDDVVRGLGQGEVDPHPSGENWREEWQEVDFGKFLFQSRKRSRRFRYDIFYPGNIELSLSDDNLKAVLICIDAVTNVESLYLSKCNLLTGRCLEPLSGSTVLKRIDISLASRKSARSNVECSLELGEVLPVLDSIVAKGDNNLRHIQFPKKWRDAEHERLGRFIARYNNMLRMTAHKCCQCDEWSCKSKTTLTREPADDF